MKRSFVLVTLAILLIGLVLLVVADTGTSIAGTSIPDSEVTNIQEADGPNSASATITITVAVADE